MKLFLAFLAVPVIEIALFIQVGGWIGLWPTLGLVIATAVAGTILVRAQGTATLLELRRSLAELRDPTEPLAHGALILFAGALLLTPGFFTDAIGILLLVPPIRRWLLGVIASRITVQRFSMGGGQAGADTTIDGDYHEIGPEKRPLDPPLSGTTRH